METRAYKIADCNLARFRAAMAHLARRAARIGVAAPSYSLADPVDAVHRDGTADRVWPCTVQGEAPRYAGWVFAAALTHVVTDDGAVQSILRALSDLPERFRAAAADCDHCGTRRRRSATFVLRSDAGQWMQVGSTCIRDFIGHDSPDHLAAQAELICDAIDAADECESLGGGSPRYSTLHFLSFVAAAMRERGWVSRQESLASYESKQATADVAYTSMVAPNEKYAVAPNDDDRVRAEASLEWARALHETGETLSDYLYNLNTVARCTVLPDRASGLAASMVSAYERVLATERERLHAAKTSRHVGTVGERSVMTLRVLSIRELDGQYGVTYLHDMVDADGNRVKWFGSSRLGDPGVEVTVKATVKAHEEYRGVAQTIVSRCAEYVAPVKKERGKRAAKVEVA